jgi:preprotein translocase subunit SecD
MSNLKYRYAIIIGLVLMSLWSLRPSKVVKRITHEDGRITFDSVWAWPPKKGLDLQGGMSITLDVDESKGVVADKPEALERALKVVRNRIDQFGVSEPNISKVGTDRIVVELPGIDDQRRAEDIVKKSAFLQFQITDNSGALDKVMARIDGIVRDRGIGTTAGPAPTDAPKPNAITGLFASDTSKSDSARADTGLLAPGPRTGAFSSLLQPGDTPGQYYVASTDVGRVQSILSLPEVNGALPPGKELLWESDTTSFGGKVYRGLYVVDSRAIITGENLVDAKPNQDPIEGVLVTFQLDQVGGRLFKRETTRYVKRNMAIVLDDYVMGRPPVINEPIGNRGQITLGGRDLQAAQDLALVLRAGALPVPLKVAEIRNIGASLGQDSIRRGTMAALVSVLAVILIMAVYYRFSGLLAIGGLALYMLFTMGALSFFDAVLTLPGLAGFVLSIGIAVDANVLIFERIREELDKGKTVRTAVDEGFRHAMSAIVDSNVSTILTAMVLYQFGTGPVRGFAVTLIAGIVASMITSIFVVKTFYLVWMNRSRGTQTLSI